MPNSLIKCTTCYHSSNFIPAHRQSFPSSEQDTLLFYSDLLGNFFLHYFFLQHLFYVFKLLQNTLQKLVYITRLGHALIILLKIGLKNTSPIFKLVLLGFCNWIWSNIDEDLKTRATRRERFPFFVVMVYCIVIESNSFLYYMIR